METVFEPDYDVIPLNRRIPHVIWNLTCLAGLDLDKASLQHSHPKPHRGQTIRTMPAQCGSCEDFLSKGISLSIRSNNASHLSLLSQQINTFFSARLFIAVAGKIPSFPFASFYSSRLFMNQIKAPLLMSFERGKLIFCVNRALPQSRVFIFTF